MQDASIVAWIRDKFQALQAELDERGRRRWAATEARSLGWGGISVVAEASGLSDRTIRNGIRELTDSNPLSPDRQRRHGAGRPTRESRQPGLVRALEVLVEPATRGDPQGPLRWPARAPERWRGRCESRDTK